MIKTLTVCGTRPEAIKLAPLLNELGGRKEIQSVLCSSGQHREMLTGALEVFDLTVDYNLELMEDSQTLSGLTARAVTGISQTIESEDPDLVLVQGDTTTAFVGALTGFYHRTAVGHVEAGLRSGDRANPFPEEINRRLADSLSDLLFAPTERAKANLLREDFTEESISVTGNTVIDALVKIESSIEKGEVQPTFPVDVTGFDGDERKLLLVTAHRRESLDGGITRIARAIKQITERFPELEVVFPVHLNPKVQEAVYKILEDEERVNLVEPVDYLTFVGLMRIADLIITDSGGIQEEAPSFGVPVLIAREKTERPEAVEVGTAKLVGTDTDKIVSEATRLLSDGDNYQKMVKQVNPFGKGNASKKIVEKILDYLN
ncbi:UDP-N-acetylglucosamine 2-epimerase (non-hydrolyzing) [Candidatus Bipolaricaulota bacterium]|nr:UDP-N-acetylglucosamine 2-epimerase (non-hydrolyzing) [Candidatus Bipolaricaulota bacterium]